MGLLKLRKNKKFSYNPKYYNGNEDGSPFEIKHKFDEYRKTVGGNKGLKGKFNDAFDDLKNNPNGQVRTRIIIIAFILIFVFLFFIDFDLSIFFSK